MYACVYCMYECMCVLPVCMYACTYISMRILHVCMYACMHVCTYACVYCPYACIHVRIHMCMCGCIRITLIYSSCVCQSCVPTEPSLAEECVFSNIQTEGFLH